MFHICENREVSSSLYFSEFNRGSWSSDTCLASGSTCSRAVLPLGMILEWEIRFLSAADWLISMVIRFKVSSSSEDESEFLKLYWSGCTFNSSAGDS